MVLNFLLGLLGLGIIVFVHELGHFISARLMGIKVEAFSIGWGKAILKKKIGEVEYRLGMFPMGGYCKMKGDGDFEEIYRKRMEGIALEEGSYFAAHPLRRIAACLGGPFFNFVFAVLVFSVIWGMGGFIIPTPSNKIVLSSELNHGEELSPAGMAGLQSGDRIISILGREINTFDDIRRVITINPNQVLPVEVDRNNVIHAYNITPLLDDSRTRGIIGIYNWIDPVISMLLPDSPAYNAGLLQGDIVTSVNGINTEHTIAFDAILRNRPEELDIEYIRQGQIYRTTVQPEYNEDERISLGIIWEVPYYIAPRLSIPMAVYRGTVETWNTFTYSISSLAMLFRGIDFTQAVSGPVRITHMTGEVAATGFSQGIGSGISAMMQFLAFISIALCMMNLLPLPVLDGGMILLFIAEMIRKKPLPPRFVNAFQTVGIVLIAGLMFFALFGDIRYLAGIFGSSN